MQKTNILKYFIEQLKYSNYLRLISLFRDVKKSLLKIRCGDWNLKIQDNSEETSDYQERTVKQVLAHPSKLLQEIIKIACAILIVMIENSYLI